MTLNGKIQAVTFSDTGLVRDHNEDAVSVQMDLGLVILADGMGGYNAGEVASEMAIKTVSNMVQMGLDKADRSEIDGSSGLRRQTIILRDAIARANKIIYQTAQSQADCEGMGTTLVAALFYDNGVSIAHVGDSRLYRLRENDFIQLTQDHSLLQELVSRGFYSPEEAQRSLNKNYVTRALGVEGSVEVEVREEPVDVNDVFVLCSDGLSDMVEDDDIRLTIRTFSDSLDNVGKQLVDLANNNGGRDNISVALARVIKPFAEPKGLLAKIKSWFN